MSESELFVFAGGGSGGHLFPGLAVATALKQLNPKAQILFLATQRDIDKRILADCGFEYITQPVVPIPRRLTAVWGFWKRWRESKRICREILRGRSPAAVLSLGGFASGPMMQVASSAGVPVAMLNPDAVPGRANRFGQRKAKRIFVQWQDSCRYFGANSTNCSVTGCPIRADFFDAKKRSRDIHLKALNIESDTKILVVVGGSQGGKNVNDATIKALAELHGDDRSPLANWQVIHLTGAADHSRMLEQYRDHNITAIVEPFSNQMPALLSVADLVIARAGASTLAELTAMGVPSILLPYPYHRDQHQLRNAEMLAKPGAAEIVLDQCDADLTSRELVKTLKDCIIDHNRLAQMGRKAVEIGKIDAAMQVARGLVDLSGSEP